MYLIKNEQDIQIDAENHQVVIAPYGEALVDDDLATRVAARYNWLSVEKLSDEALVKYQNEIKKAQVESEIELAKQDIAEAKTFIQEREVELKELQPSEESASTEPDEPEAVEPVEVREVAPLPGLLKKTRGQLEELATELEVNIESAKNKQDIAEAIVASGKFLSFEGEAEVEE